jgi:hypothetical protein
VRSERTLSEDEAIHLRDAAECLRLVQEFTTRGDTYRASFWAGLYRLKLADAKRARSIRP